MFWSWIDSAGGPFYDLIRVRNPPKSKMILHQQKKEYVEDKEKRKVRGYDTIEKERNRKKQKKRKRINRNWVRDEERERQREVHLFYDFNTPCERTRRSSCENRLDTVFIRCDASRKKTRSHSISTTATTPKAMERK